MCGRVVYIWDAVTGALVRKLDERSLDDPARRHVLEKQRYNVPPASHLPVFASNQGVAHIEVARWGFPIPARPNGVFNTRIEGAAESPMWRGMLGKTHCVFPVKGFYEWERAAPRRPHYIHHRDDGVMLLAGLLGRRLVGGDSVLCASIVTCAANPALAPLHDRMPVILEESALHEWLQPNGVEDALRLAVPADAEILALHAVGTAVNATKNDSPGLLQPDRTQRLDV